MGNININTSVDDLRSSLKCSIKGYTIEDFEQAEMEELEGRNRVSILRLLSRAKRMKRLGARMI